MGFVFMLRSVGFVPVLSCSLFYFFNWFVVSRFSGELWLGRYGEPALKFEAPLYFGIFFISKKYF
jgi:hypothetical protein